MKKNSHEAIAEKLRGEITGGTDRVARTVFGDVPPGGKQLTQAEYRDYLERNIGDPGFRAGLLTRVGPVEFRRQILDVTGLGDEAWPLPEGMKDG